MKSTIKHFLQCFTFFENLFRIMKKNLFPLKLCNTKGCRHFADSLFWLYPKPLWFWILYFWEFEVLTSLKIISGDMCGRNGLKSKVSTLEELYDFFSENTQKLHRMMWFLELSTFCRQALFFYSFFSSVNNHILAGIGEWVTRSVVSGGYHATESNNR